MALPVYLIAQIFGVVSFILAIISFIIMVTSWKKEDRPLRRAIYPIITSFLIALTLVLLLYGYKFI